MSYGNLGSGVAQVVFFINVVWSLRHGREAGRNPWRATTLEWQTEDVPPGHGNFGKELPVVYRWAYDYSVPGHDEDFLPQNMPPAAPPADKRRDDLPGGALQPAE